MGPAARCIFTIKVTMDDPHPLTASWSTEQSAAMRHLHAWTTAFEELSHRQAAFVHLPTKDADALGQVVWAAEQDEAVSPGELARQVGLTSGATTALLKRLEAAGLVRRTREHDDRRRVTLRPTAEGRDRAHAFLALAGTEIAAELRTLAPETLAHAIDFLARITTATEQANRRLARLGEDGS